MAKRNRITVSWELMTTSLQLLLADKRILWAPILAVLVSLILGGIFAVPIIFDLVQWAEQSQMQNTPVSLLIMFVVYYVLLYFVSTFTGAMVISHIHRRLNGQVTSLGVAFSDAWQRVGALFLWSVLAASIGMLIQNLERSHLSIAAIISGLFVGLAWGVISFFALPIIVIDKVGVFDGIKQSMQVIRQQWGGMVLGMVGLFFLVLTLIGIGVLVATVKYSHNIELTLIVSVIAILYIVAVGIIRATIYMVFRTVLLHYAKTGKMPNGVSQTVLRS